jgi:hypothetical protein
LLHDHWVIREIREGIKMFLEFNENGNRTYQNLWEITKAVLRVELIAMNAYVTNIEALK